MKKTKRILATLLTVCLTTALVACGDTGNASGSADNGNAENVANAEEAITLTIAYQGGIGYAPVHIMETEKLIEKNYGKDIEVTFVKLDSGAAINEGIIGGTIDIGCMGVAPAISGVAAGIPYKVISNLCSQSHGLMSNSKEITSLKDITDEDKIALVNTGSIQHILLAMAAEKTLGDAHALDNNIQAMSHAEGMAALESGTVALHLTSSPFIYQERANENYTELPELAQVWPSGNSFLVAMASTKMVENEALFNAVSQSFEEAVAFANTNVDETAEIEVEYLGLDNETVMSYLEEEDCQFFSELAGAETMADFMYSAGFITKEVAMEEFKYDSVESR